MGRREMKELYGGFAAASWPRPANPAQAEIELERWHTAVAELENRALRRFAETLSSTTTGRALLASIFGNSPYLAQIALDDPEFTVDLLRRGPDVATALIFTEMRRNFGGEVDEATLMAG